MTSHNTVIPREHDSLHFENVTFNPSPSSICGLLGVVFGSCFLTCCFFSLLNLATVVVWDSQVKDGYKRKQAPAADGSAAGDTSTAPLAWDGKKMSGVVEELLRNSKDKAYGANGETKSDVNI